jgi:hypothetical protein
MGKVYDLEKERQKAKDRAKEHPPLFGLWSKDGNLHILPRLEKAPDGEWHIMRLDLLKTMLGYGKEKTDKEEEPEGP